MNKSNDLNIYAFNALKSSKLNLDEDYSFLSSLLIGLEHQIDTGHLSSSDYATALLKAINNTDAFFTLDRVCLVYAEPLSSRLSVVTSAQSESMAENNMASGYSCYVSEESSLFSIKKSAARIYNNIDDILKTYSGTKPQRSIKRLANMGVKSGITIPLGQFGFFSGILFLNSIQEGHFKNFKDGDYAILSLIKLISSNMLYRHLHGGISVDKYIFEKVKEQRFDNIFNFEKFKKTLFHFLTNRFSDHHFEIEGGDSFKGHEILYNATSFTYFLLRLLEYDDSWRSQSPFKISFSYNQSKNSLEVVLFGFQMDFKRLAFFEELGFFMSDGIKLKEGNTLLSFEVESAIDQLKYSVD